jgi:hypothetical protein
MASIQVRPELLDAGGARQTALASRLHDLSMQLRTTTAGASGAAGEGPAGAAIQSFGQGWSSVLVMLSETIATQGRNLGAAGAAYVATDRCVVRGPGS